MQMSTKSYVGLGHVPIGIGAVLKGWDIIESHYRDPNTLPVVNFRAMTNACPFNCFHCFTEKMKKTLSLREIKETIDQLADMNTHAIDFVGEGEPTIDKDFFDIVEYTASKNIQPVVYTEAATRLRDRDFARRLFDTGATVCPKCDSLYSAEYQNWVVGDKKGRYFAQRNEAIEVLIDVGFNKTRDDGTTRLGFDMVVSKRNYHEVEQTLRYCRSNNIWIIFVFYLTAGRSAKDTFDKALAVTESEKAQIRSVVKRVDEEYGHHHLIWNNFATMRCVEFVQIFGDGRVSACPGNEVSIGNVRDAPLRELRDRLLRTYPHHDKTTMDGHCPYRPPITPQGQGVDGPARDVGVLNTLPANLIAAADLIRRRPPAGA